MSNIVKRSDLPEKARQELADAGLELNIGDVFMVTCWNGSEPKLYKISEIRVSDKKKNKGHIEFIGYKIARDFEGLVWSENTYGGFNSMEEAQREMKDWMKVEGSVSEWRQKALDFIEGKTTAEDYADKESDKISSETAIIGKSTKNTLLVLQGELERKRSKAELVAAFVSLEMEKRRAELEKMREKMYEVVAQFQKKLKKIMRVITTIELYLGIDEELFQIQEGEKAPQETPISFRQAVLYMDEEVGYYENEEGLDFRNIKWFDEWLIKDNNYKNLLPEEKGVVVFRPRRYDRKYEGYDPEQRALMNMYNKVTYLLIRNGENLYRVYTEKITIAPRLFPLRKEFAELLATMEEKMNDPDYWDDSREKEQMETIQYNYRKRAVLMQGLIDRTEIFYPLPVEKISMFNLDATPDAINFIYDDEATLPFGKLPFWDWHKELNKGIQHGSRILITGYYKQDGYTSRRDFRGRLFYYCSEHSVPPAPSTGVYTVEEYKEECEGWTYESDYEKIKAEGRLLETMGEWHKSDRILDWEKKKPEDYVYEREIRCKFIQKHLTIMYNPKDTVYGSWGEWKSEERKNRIRWKIYPPDNSDNERYNGDKFMLNYDQLSLEDVDFYLTSRPDRPNYLSMMPILQQVKIFLLEEQEKEKHFIDLVYSQTYKSLSFLSEKMVRARIVRCIDWWKYKNQFKRAITKDDTLALRMIVKRITSNNWVNLKWD